MSSGSAVGIVGECVVGAALGTGGDNGGVRLRGDRGGGAGGWGIVVDDAAAGRKVCASGLRGTLERREAGEGKE